MKEKLLEQAKPRIQAITLFLIAIFVVGCANIPNATINKESTPMQQPNPPIPSSTPQQQPVPFDSSKYAFPGSIDPARRYLFYLHGKIIEDQGLPAISPVYGEYEYPAILEKLGSYGFVVISEQRAKNTDGIQYAHRVKDQIADLLNSSVPAKNITVVGASQGATITVFVSHFLANKEVNFAIMAICNPEEVEYLKSNGVYLYGNVLSIYDSVDELGGSCRELFSLSEGISRQDEIVLHVGTGHGILYKPLDEWILPVIRWAGIP